MFKTVLNFIAKQSNVYRELLQTHERLKTSKVQLEHEVASMRFKVLDASCYTDNVDAEFVFDFSSKKVFSIERNKQNNLTVISFDDTDALRLEWSFDCSVAQHNKLVAEWKKEKSQ
jgi:hypothetical protein